MKDKSGPDHGFRRKGAAEVSGAAYAGMGLQFALSIVLFLFVGQWLDKRLGTGSTFTLLGVFVGGGGAFYSIYRRLMAAQRKEEAEKAKDGKGLGV